MTLSFIRVLFIMLSGVVGYYIGTLMELQNAVGTGTTHFYYPLLGAEIGCVTSLILIFIEKQLRRVSVRGLSSVVFGLLLGIIMARLISNILSLLPLGGFLLSVSELVLTLVFSYLGAVMALRGKDEFNIIIPYVRFKRQDVKEDVILLDTSAIIDGRVADIYKTHFLTGRLVILQSVLAELQQLSDSENDIKRQRGRRGMDLVARMKEDPKVDVHIHEEDATGDLNVDQRLLAVAKVMGASICTTDYNLGRVAQMQGIDVLNIHDLVNAAKSTVYVGDELKIILAKEGKEAEQAVGYLDDGTMVVVSGGRSLIGQTVAVRVTSVLQTQAGKMIFADMVKRS